jgi:enamine deaminase RidA (YjgF/YER057c/UK114 family)
MPKSNRRRFIAGASAAAAAVAVPSTAIGKPGPFGNEERRPAPVGPGERGLSDTKKVYWEGGKRPDKTPLFSSAVSYGNLLFIAGVGAHFEGDIKAHTKHVLDEVQKRLESAGSSMEKVVKVNVYLNDLKDYSGMNEVFLGRFGPEPPVRTTIAAAGGIPGNSLVEIDCIAYI